ncbi:MAG: FG-GAP-like repeat-containing protein [bacterium]
MFSKNKKRIFQISGALMLLALVVFAVVFFFKKNQSPTLTSNLEKYGISGQQILEDLNAKTQITPVKAEGGFEVVDDMKEGIDIQFANQPKPAEKPEENTKVLFPDSLDKPMVVSLAGGKSISITDKNGTGKLNLLNRSGKVPEKEIDPTTLLPENKNATLPEQLKNFVEYQSQDKRKSSYFAYQKEATTGERKLKSWTLFASGNGKESEAYEFSNAKIAIDQDGNAKVFFDNGKDAQNQQAMAEVDQSLLARAQKAIMADAGTDIMSKDSNAMPDFTVPRPYFVDSQGQLVELAWTLSEDGKTISVDFEVKNEQYPIALDPTLSFVAPGQSNTASVITGENASDKFAISMANGDFNADGRMDLAINAPYYNTNTGRVYIFYNDGNFSSLSKLADVIIDGEFGYFGIQIAAGDLNADGKTDLVANASVAGKTYIFYNDGSYPSLAASADVKISCLSAVGISIGDFNADGKTDLAIGRSGSEVDIFYNKGGSYPASSASADVIITPESGGATFFATSMVAGDFNADGKTDLAVGIRSYNGSTGRAYVFYSDNLTGGAPFSLPLTTLSNASVVISGEATSNYFGYVISAGDFNADGKTDLAVGAYGYGTGAGRAYIFYGGSLAGTILASTGANVIISGEASNDHFGISLVAGDFNADGKTDLAVSADHYSAFDNGKVYIFYGGSLAATITAVSASVTIAGENASDYFGGSLVAGDFNGDGKADLSVGAYGFSASTGRAYIFYSQNGQVNTNKKIVGSATNNYFGTSMTAGDFNADGKIDLAVGCGNNVCIFFGDGTIPATSSGADVVISGARSTSTSVTLAVGDFNADGKTDLGVADWMYGAATGQVYIFYGSSNLPTTISASSANVIITGAASNYFGASMTAGDFNADGKTDLAVGCSQWTSKVYLFYGGNLPATLVATSADVTFTGSQMFGQTLASGDLNSDGKTDLVVNSNNNGVTRIFYGGSFSASIAEASANVTITGESATFGIYMTVGDFNTDGKTDLALGDAWVSSSIGKVYIFYNDGSIPTTAVNADVVLTGGAINDNFCSSITSGDFNSDGKTDLVVGAYGTNANTGTVYFYETRDAYAWQIQKTQTANRISGAMGQELTITGKYDSGQYRFGASMATGDFNADGKMDLAVGGGSRYIYIYYNDGTITNLASGADAIITGENSSSNFGIAGIVAGDFNSDGKTDLAVGDNANSVNLGRVYIFYNDGSFPSLAANADVVITGSTALGQFGRNIVAGDFNADGRVDLAVASSLSVFIFNNDGLAYPTTSATADLEISSTDSIYSMTTGDFNADGKTDLAFGSVNYSGSTGRVYIFYNNNGISQTTVATADVVITGGAVNNNFGSALAAGDFNSDGRIDLAVAAFGYSAGSGAVFIFNNDGLPYPATSATADVSIAGESGSWFGNTLASGDFNADGRTDLAVGTFTYQINKGAVYVFNNDGSIPTTAGAADVKVFGEKVNDKFGFIVVAGDLNNDGKTDLIVGACDYIINNYLSAGKVYIYTSNETKSVGETASQFATSMTTGDFNGDGKIDLAVGATGFNPGAAASTGRTYIFYNDGAIPTTAATADVVITGEAAGNYFGSSLTAGDFNADGVVDFVVGAYGFNVSTGRAYIFYGGSGLAAAITAISANVVLTGGTTADFFGWSFAAGDFNVDGKTDLAIGSFNYSTYTGRVYIFYGGSFVSPVAVGAANVLITGETTSNNFGLSLASGDFNSDGKTDLAVGANTYTSTNGRAYVFYADGTNNFGTAVCAGAQSSCLATNADVIISGEANSALGSSLIAGDFNADGKMDLAISGNAYATNAGRVYVFYGGNITTKNATSADALITGEASSNYFGSSMVAGDFNSDGKTDLAVGSYGYSSSAGRTYLFYDNKGITSGVAGSITGIAIGSPLTAASFGSSLAVADLSGDGNPDLIVGAPTASSSAGTFFVYPFEAGPNFQGLIKAKGAFKIHGKVKFR